MNILPVKTTILLKDEIHDHLIKKVGRRKISETINRMLEKELYKSKRSMFGADPWLETKNLRDEEESHEGF